MTGILNWVVDTLARTETLDLYFIVTDLIDFPQSDNDIVEQAEGDAMARSVATESKPKKRVPLGKQVF